MKGRTAFERLAEVSDRAVEAAVRRSEQQLGVIHEATRAPSGRLPRGREKADALLGRGDEETLGRLRRYGPYLSAAERGRIDRRARAAGVPAVFGEATGVGEEGRP